MCDRSLILLNFKKKPNVEMTELGLGPFSFKHTRPQDLYLKPGQTIILHVWSWRKLGYTRKFVQCDKDGHLSVIHLD